MPSMQDIIDALENGVKTAPSYWKDKIVGALDAGWVKQPIERDTAYEYGSILPFRKNIATRQVEWSPQYSDLAKSAMDAFTAPGRALAGQVDPNSLQGVAEANNFAQSIIESGMGYSAAKMAKGEMPSTSTVGMVNTPAMSVPDIKNTLNNLAENYGGRVAYIHQGKTTGSGSNSEYYTLHIPVEINANAPDFLAEKANILPSQNGFTAQFRVRNSDHPLPNKYGGTHDFDTTIGGDINQKLKEFLDRIKEYQNYGR